MLIFKKAATPEAVFDHLVDDTYGDYGSDILIDGGVYPSVLGPTGAARQKFKLTHGLHGEQRYLRKGSAGLIDVHTLNLSDGGLQVVRLYLYKGRHTSFGFTPENQGELLEPLLLAAYGVHTYLNQLDEASATESVVEKIYNEQEMRDISFDLTKTALNVQIEQRLYGQKL